MILDVQFLKVEFQATLQSLGEDVAVPKKMISQGASPAPEAPPKVRVPKPKVFQWEPNCKGVEELLVGYGAVLQGCTFVG